MGISKASVEVVLSKGEPRPWNLSTYKVVRRGMQKHIIAPLKPRSLDKAFRLRRKLEKLQLSIFPGPAEFKIWEISNLLGVLTPPRVHAAALRSWLGGWTTLGRFQKSGWCSKCTWGCTCRSGDNLKHYMVCPVLARWRESRSGLPQGDTLEEKKVALSIIRGIPTQ